jgi:hypothetical protein
VHAELMHEVPRWLPGQNIVSMGDAFARSQSGILNPTTVSLYGMQELGQPM